MDREAEAGDLDAIDGDEGVIGWVRAFPPGRFLPALLDGWRLPFVVEPSGGAHGMYSIHLTREDEPK